MEESVSENSPLAQLDRHLAAEGINQSRATGFDMDDKPEASVLAPFPRLNFALEKIGEILVPIFQRADAAAIEHQRNHKRNAKIAASMGALAIVAACVQLGFTTHDTTPMSVVIAEIIAVGVCLVAILIGVRTARQKNWLVCRNVAERLRHLKFHSLTRKELWCEPTTAAWEAWLREKVSGLGSISKREDLEAWVTNDPLLDPPAELSQCAAASKEAAALMCYFRHKRVAFQRGFFALRAKQHAAHQHHFHHIPGRCFWISIVAALLHFTLELIAGGLANEQLRHFAELLARWSIVVAAATPAIGAGVRTWLLAFEFGRSALLYRAQHSCLDKRLDALQNNSPDRIFAAIWFTEQALEEEHRAWIRLMLDAEWFG